MQKKLHYARNDYNVGLPRSIEEAEGKNWEQPTFLWSEEWAADYHQDPDIDGVERKFVGPNGHKEIIFSVNGEEITSDEYKGTYNFFSPSQKIRHTQYDIRPYFEWGNNVNDSNYN